MISRKKLHVFFLILVCVSIISLAQNITSFKTYIQKMKNAELNGKGELIIAASETSSVSDFDFLLGTHNVQHEKLRKRLSGSTEWQQFNGIHKMESLLEGSGNLEQHSMALSEEPNDGIALRLFNPATRLWSIYWANSISGTLDVPVVGSFENKVGFFYAKDHYGNKPILVQFKWDASKEDLPVWSQAFSVDNGETWEWNWHMYFSKLNKNTVKEATSSASADKIGVIELRNYVIKQRMRDSFIHYFEENFITPQEELKGYLLGQYRVKGSENNFCWIRGFKDMKERSSFLPAFYYGPVWKQHKAIANSMLANNDNVYLLQPMTLKGDSLIAGDLISRSQLNPGKGIAVVNFYTANSKLNELLKIFSKEYIALLKDCGAGNTSFWTSVLQENDFPRLPVFQDKNLLVTISFFKNELDYEEIMKKIDQRTSEDLRSRLQDAITITNTMFLYPTEQTMNQK
jgi:hypothetical protein